MPTRLRHVCIVALAGLALGGCASSPTPTYPYPSRRSADVTIALDHGLCVVAATSDRGPGEAIRTCSPYSLAVPPGRHFLLIEFGPDGKHFVRPPRLVVELEARPGVSYEVVSTAWKLMPLRECPEETERSVPTALVVRDEAGVVVARSRTPDATDADRFANPPLEFCLE